MGFFLNIYWNLISSRLMMKFGLRLSQYYLTDIIHDEHDEAAGAAFGEYPSL